MSIPIPPSKPKASLSLVIDAATKEWQKKHIGTALPEFFVLFVRAYFSETIAPAGNNLNAYDDACFIVSPLGMSAWNANTDPTRYGWNGHADKYMARLKPGCYRYTYLMHRNSYMAFGQGRHPVTVHRIRQDGSVAMEETGEFGINDHLGGDNGTSSEGCLTHPPAQWVPYRTKLRDTMRRLGVETYDLILTDGPIN